MAVETIGNRRLYIGLSTDEKPTTYNAGEKIPKGSEFRETDTGRLAFWDGHNWTVSPTDTLVLDRLDTIFNELHSLRLLHTEALAKMMRE